MINTYDLLTTETHSMIHLPIMQHIGLYAVILFFAFSRKNKVPGNGRADSYYCGSELIQCISQ